MSAAERYERLVEEARSLGIPTSLDDPRSPRTVQGLLDAIVRAEDKLVRYDPCGNGYAPGDPKGWA